MSQWRERENGGMLGMTKLPVSVLGSLLLVASAGYVVAAEQPASAPRAAPTVRCEMQMTVWCIREGTQKVISQFSDQGAYRRAWTVSGFFQPKWPLVVLEPQGCRDGLSDTLLVVGFDAGVEWGQNSWNRIRVRLKEDRSCDLELLVPYYSDDASGEAFFGGLALIQACTTSTCTGPSLGSVRGELEERWRAAKRSTP